jgi:ssDNA-binding Zn-finger/Zn-ribbon topoisomerase 1
MKRIKEFFGAFLRLPKPIFVKKIVKDDKGGNLVVCVDLPEGSKVACSKCGQGGFDIAERSEQFWKYPHQPFNYRTLIRFDVPMVNCPKCGLQMMALPWLKKSRQK